MNVQKSFDHTIYRLSGPEWLSTGKGKSGKVLLQEIMQVYLKKHAW